MGKSSTLGQIPNRVTVDSSGNLGVGTTNPSAGGKVAVVSGAGATSLYLTDATNSTLAVKHQSGSLLTYETTGSAAQRWITNGAERLRIKATGQVRFTPLASAPTDAAAGDVYYNSTDNKLYCHNGTSWNALF